MGCGPPPHLSVQIMRQALAYEVQCKVLGGLSKASQDHLQGVARGLSAHASSASTARQYRVPRRDTILSPGAVLVREWNGRTYQVSVLSDGNSFELDGKRYKSLSAIARHITGTRWSGPRFFGLTKDVYVQRTDIDGDPDQPVLAPPSARRVQTIRHRDVQKRTPRCDGVSGRTELV